MDTSPNYDSSAAGHVGLSRRSLWTICFLCWLCVVVVGYRLITAPDQHTALMQLELQPALRGGADPASEWSSEVLNTQAVIVASRGICDRASARLLARSRGPTETTDSARSLRRALICDRLSAT